MTRSATSMAISPKRFDASSTAPRRARATSTSAPPTMRSNSAWARVCASTRTASAVWLAWATISRAVTRASSRTERGSDLLLSLRQGRVERRDDVLHDDQDQDDRDGQLNEEGPVGKEEDAC